MAEPFRETVTHWKQLHAVHHDVPAMRPCGTGQVLQKLIEGEWRALLLQLHDDRPGSCRSFNVWRLRSRRASGRALPVGPLDPG